MSRRESNQQPWLLERRAFLKLGAGFGLTSMLLGWTDPTQLPLLGLAKAAGTTVTTRNTARNCLMIMLRGGPSHVDTFDLKVGKWTPKKFTPENVSAGYLWPKGLMPGLAARSDKFAIIRSLQHQELLHERAEYYAETGRRLNPGLRAEIPHIGSVIALEQEAKRSASDIFPAFAMFNLGSYT
ncbi:MAG: DUF1501 domain-containing protein, partial [Acidobacteriota bacterium]